ncbi:MAG: teicoplanin resistance protein VanZ [Deltaproteobacteria bacterium]|nr:MAG: teicoplanin resistance protein VanZ [Deltaproteobacteria bacterium]
MRAWLPVAVYAALILAVSSIPASRMPQSPTLWSFDKLLHAGEYFVLGALLARALSLGPPRVDPVIAVAISAIVCAAFGAVDEAYQSLTPGRSSSPWDAVADAVGAAAGALSAAWWFSRQGVDVDRA